MARAGDAWTLGPHRLVCGDDLDAPAFSALDAAIRRWQTVTGESARLRSTGETFDKVARSRGALTPDPSHEGIPSPLVGLVGEGEGGGSGHAFPTVRRGSLNRKIQRDPPPQPYPNPPPQGQGNRR